MCAVTAVGMNQLMWISTRQTAMRKIFYFTETQAELLTALAEELTRRGKISPRNDVKGAVSESAAIRWLIEQEWNRQHETPNR